MKVFDVGDASLYARCHKEQDCVHCHEEVDGFLDRNVIDMNAIVVTNTLNAMFVNAPLNPMVRATIELAE